MGLTVTIVRHGNTFETGAPLRRIGARTDLPLVASGRDQADALGVLFAGRALWFDRALSAPLQRTRKTTELILAHQPQRPDVEMADWLTEVDHGPDEGQLEQDVLARIGAEALSAWDHSAIRPAGWIINEEHRLQGWRRLWENGEGNVLIVTSNGSARFALRSDEMLMQQALVWPSLKLRTGAYGVIERERVGLRLVAWDQRP